MDPVNNINVDKDKPYLYWYVFLKFISSFLFFKKIVLSVCVAFYNKKRNKPWGLLSNIVLREMREELAGIVTQERICNYFIFSYLDLVR